MSRKSVAGSTYPDDWKDIARRTKLAAGLSCIRCHRYHDPPRVVLTVHHADMDPRHNAWYNLLSLCARCHLTIQAKVDLSRPWVLEHSEWAKPYMAGHYAKRYLGLDLTRGETMERLDELLKLEAQAVLGVDPIPVLAGDPR